MEILAPAGNMEQAIASINAGCDALYGGLKQWNARNRASNFTLKDYNKLRLLCCEKNVRFYLTINTLLKNKEIEDILKLLSSGEIILPDAIIATDIGFIITLREQYPNIPIHASTQFGATSLDDVRLLESIGVERVILARELLLPEIEHICKNTTMEIEVFAYGSQCVALSGQCLWGGLLNGASGNRGRCIGMCRDLYRHSNEIGQFLYPQDINAVKILNQLEKIGVHSVKIEGRMRPKDEISSVISYFKSQSLKFNEKGFYAGFLSYKTPVAEMFHAVNPRTKYSKLNAEMTKNDLLLDDVNGYVFGNSISDSKSVKFIKSLHTKSLSTSQINLSIKAFVFDQKLVKIDYINTYGERNLYSLTDSPKDITTITELHNKLEHELLGNLYEFSSDVPDNTIIEYSKDDLKWVITAINESCKNVEVYKEECAPSIENDFSVVTSCVDKIMHYKQVGAKKIIYNIINVEDLKKAVLLTNKIENLYFRLPILDFNGYMSEIFRILHGKSIVITKLSQIQHIKKYNFQDIIADFSLNLWNIKAIEHLKNYGVTQLIYHPELSYEYNHFLSDSTGTIGYAIIYGRLPIGYTRGCFGECGLCDCDNFSSFTLDNISKGYSVQISCYKEAGYRSIIPNKAFSCSRKIDKDVNKIFVESIPQDVGNEPTFKIYSRSVK